MFVILTVVVVAETSVNITGFDDYKSVLSYKGIDFVNVLTSQCLECISRMSDRRERENSTLKRIL